MATFSKLPENEERQLLLTDTPDFSNTQKYLLPLIDSALKSKISNPELRNKLQNEILLNIPLASQKFLKHSPEENLSFATYFTWYIAKAINSDEVQLSLAGPIKKLFYKIKMALKKLMHSA